MIEAAKRKILQILKFPNNVLFVNCVVPENIHTPTTEGIGNSGGVGGQKPRKSRGEGV